MRDRNKLSERQRSILRFMQTFFDEFGYPPTIREIGEATQIDSTSVVNYNLNKLVSAGYIERSGRKSRGLRLVKSDGAGPRRVQPTPQISKLAIVGQIVASEPVPIPDDMGRATNEDDTIEISPVLLRGLDPAEVFALRVKGESMIDAMIDHGDIVILRRQETAENGDMVAVWLDERGETTLKRFYHEGAQIRLQPAHPTMKPIYVDPAHCHVQGRVLAVIRQLD